MRILVAARRIELKLLQWTVFQRDRRLVVPFARSISRTGDGYLPVITVVVCLLAGTERAVLLANQLIVAFTIERAFYFFLKNTLKRPRPANGSGNISAVINAADKFSFPSGHSSAACLYATAIYLHFPLLGILLFVWTLMVGSSRIVLGVHYPSDVLAGFALGSFVALLVCV